MSERVWSKVDRFSLIEKTLLNMIIGFKELFKSSTAIILYHTFKKAYVEEARRIVEEIAANHGDESEIINKGLEFLKKEGFCQEVELKCRHIDRKVLLKVRNPSFLLLRDFAERFKVKLTDQEISAIGRGIISGLFSALINSDVDVDKDVMNVDRGEVIYILSEKVYDRLFR